MTCRDRVLLFLLFHVIQFWCGAINYCSAILWHVAEGAIVSVSPEVSINNAPPSNDCSLSGHNHVVHFLVNDFMPASSGPSKLCASWRDDVAVRANWKLLKVFNDLRSGSDCCKEKNNVLGDGRSFSIIEKLDIERSEVADFKVERCGKFYPNPRPLIVDEILASISELYPKSAKGENGKQGQYSSENRHQIESLRHFGWFLVFVAGLLYCFAMWCIGVNRESIKGSAPLNPGWLILVGLIVMVLATVLAGHALRLTLAARL
jgi:hypothetical protein